MADDRNSSLHVGRRDSSLGRLARLAGMVLVAGAVVVAFWYSNERTMERIRQRQAIFDGTGQLTERQISAVHDFAAWLESQYGLELRLQVSQGVLDIPSLDARTLYIGLAPENGVAVVELPPLLAKTLSPELASSLTRTHFTPYFEDGTWPLGLAAAMENIRLDLTGSPSIPDQSNPQ